MRHLMATTMLLALFAGACALTSKADLVETRYFSPERVKSPLGHERADPAQSLQVKLGRVSSGPNLRERIAHRDTPYELGYYEELRWTERPETYVRRGLSRSLFESHGMHRVLGGSAPTLDVEVIAFDHLRMKKTPAVQVQLKVILYQDNSVIYEETLTVEHPVAGSKIEDVVAAMSAALDAATDQVALEVQTALTARRSTAGRE